MTPYSVTYTGTPYAAAGTAKGVLGESLSGLVLTGTTHTNAGDYPSDPWTFTDVTGNYNNASGTVHDSIAKANPTVAVTPYSVTYSGTPHTAAGTAKAGHVPPRIIDQRLGRGAVLEQAINDAVPQLYGKALEDSEIRALGQPDLEITKLDDGEQLSFTAEVDVRPKFDLPDLPPSRSPWRTPRSARTRWRSTSAACGSGSRRCGAWTGPPPKATSSRSTCPRR